MTQDGNSKIDVQKPTALKDYFEMKKPINHRVFMTLSHNLIAEHVKLDQQVKEALERK